MHKLIFTFILIAFIIAGAVEGINPPRQTAEIEVEPDEDIKSLPSDFVKIFDAQFKHFLTQGKQPAVINMSAFAGLNAVGAKAVFKSDALKLYITALADTLITSHYSGKVFGQFSKPIARKFPSVLNFSGIYERREHNDWYPRCYGAETSGKFLLPTKTALLALDFALSAFMRDNYPNNEYVSGVLKEVPDRYVEGTGSLNMRSYGYVLPWLGAFGGAGYALARRGEDLIPQSCHSVVIGAFVEKFPLIARLGIGAAKMRDEQKITIRPATQIRWMQYPFFAEASYGIGIERNDANSLADHATVAPSSLKIAIVESVGVQFRYAHRKIAIGATGTYGSSKHLAYTTIDTSFGFAIHSSEGTIASASGWMSYTDTIAKFPYRNIITATFNRHSLPNGHLLPMVPKSIVVDSIYLELVNWLSFWGAVQYNSGFFTDDLWTSWKEGYYFFSCGTEIKWRALRIAIEIENITQRWIYEEPYYPHGKREIRLYIGIQRKF